MEEKIEAYEETKRYINRAIEEITENKDEMSCRIYSGLNDILEVIEDEIEKMQSIIELIEEKEYMEKEQNRVYREAQGF